MTCEKCGKRLYVISTRHSDSDSEFYRNKGLIALAVEVVGWYTADWIVRQRKCRACGLNVKTIEISIEDLQDGWDKKE